MTRVVKVEEEIRYLVPLHLRDLIPLHPKDTHPKIRKTIKPTLVQVLNLIQVRLDSLVLGVVGT